MTFTTRTRASRGVFIFNPYADGLNAASGFTARTGQVLTCTRGGTANAAMARDSNGIWYPFGTNAPRLHYHYNGTTNVPTLLREGAGTNSALGSCSWADSTYWTNSASFTIAAVTSCISGTTAYKHTDAAGSVSRVQTVGTFVNAQADCWSVIFENTNAEVSDIAIYDSTAAAFLFRGRLTWATMAVSTVSGTGTIGVIDLGTGPNGGRMARLYSVTTGTGAGTGASGNTRRAYAIPCFPAGAACTIHHAQFEAATSVPSSPIVTVAGAVTRAADLISVAWPYAPQGCTVYVDAYDLNGATGTPTLFHIGGANAGTAQAFAPYKGSAKWTAFLNTAAGTSSSASAAAASYGDRIELRPFLTVSGANVTATIGQSLNGGAEAVAAAGTSRALDATWNGSPNTKLYIGALGSGATAANLAIRSLCIVLGPEQSMATMRTIVAG